jgi:hypothetical protein
MGAHSGVRADGGDRNHRPTAADDRERGHQPQPHTHSAIQAVKHGVVGAHTKYIAHWRGVDPHSTGLNRRLRFTISLLAAALVWLASGSARADAPQCDSRGAITFAPNPTLEEPNTSMDVGQPDDCSAKTVELAYQHGRSPSAIDTTPQASQALAPAVLTILPATPTAEVAATDWASIRSRIERDRVERPPR